MTATSQTRSQQGAIEWEKLGNVFDPQRHAGQSWLKEFAQSPSALIFDQFVRIYFCARPPRSADGGYTSHLTFVDVDRADPRRIIRVCERPILPLGGYGTFDEFGTYPISVIRHDNGSQSDIRVYYAGITRCESVPFNAAIGLAISHDHGETFQRMGEGPVLSYSPDEPFTLGSPRIRKFNNTWYLWYVAGKAWVEVDQRPEPIYKIRMAISADGIHWQPQGRDLIADSLDEQECQACPDVLFKDGRYHMFFSYRGIQNYRQGAGGYRIGYAVSDDLLHWSRRDAVAGMQVSESGWDAELVNYPHVFELDGQVYMLYQGNEMGRTGFGLARLVQPLDWSVL